MDRAAINFASVNLEVIDINTNVSPDIYINSTGVTISRRVLEDMSYPQTVQFCTNPSQRIFAIRICKSNESKAVTFSKPKGEQTSTLSLANRNLYAMVTALIPDYQLKSRYKVTGQYDAEGRTMYFDMASAEISEFRGVKA